MVEQWQQLRSQSRPSFPSTGFINSLYFIQIILILDFDFDFSLTFDKLTLKGPEKDDSNSKVSWFKKNKRKKPVKYSSSVKKDSGNKSSLKWYYPTREKASSTTMTTTMTTTSQSIITTSTMSYLPESKTAGSPLKEDNFVDRISTTENLSSFGGNYRQLIF